MQLLDTGLVQDRYDVAVVGAGIGGLTAAALLAKRGLRTLVIEQHYLPGGACTSMRRRDITFDVGVAMMFGFGPTGFNPHRFIMNELEEPIDVIPHESLYRMHLMGRDLTFWRDFERFFRELAALFPHQETELRRLYDHFHSIYDRMILRNEIVVPPTEMRLRDALRNFLRNPLGMLGVLPLFFLDTERLVKRFVTDPEVLAFFNMLTCTYCYCDARETPALLSGALFCDNHEGGAYYPAGSPQMLANKLEKAIERHGGQMLYRRLVDEILIRRGAACGVRLADGTEIRADRVVANVTVWNLYGGLVRPRHIRPERLAWARRQVPTFGSLLLYLGVDAEAIPPGTPPILMFVEDVHNITGRDITVYVSSLDDPSLCPPGMHTVTVVQPSMDRWPRPWDPAYRSEAYRRRKQSEAEKLLDQVEKHFPGLRRHIRVMEVGTPSTIERFTRKNWGAVGGPKMMMGQELLHRLKARSEWKNLYLCGDSTVMGIGIPATSVSGVGAANRVLRDLGLREYVPRPFPRQYVRYVRGRPRAPAPRPTEPLTAGSAARAAVDCQHCESPACRDACPAGMETSMFARRIEAGNLAGAARAARERNPFAETCGAICPAERFCERHCHRLEFDHRPVRIRDLHGWVCAQVPGPEGWGGSLPPRNGRRVAVVGAGPAGLTCAHFLSRLGIRTDILEKRRFPGGIPARAIPPSRLPAAVLEREIRGMTLPGMTFRFDTALGRDVSLRDLETAYDALFLSPGLGSGSRLQLPGLERSRVTDALRFLEGCRRRTRKVGARVVVIGSGSVAADAALTAARLGARQVTLVCLEAPEDMPCLPGEREAMKRRGIRVENRWGPGQALSANRIRWVRCRSVFDASGAFRPVFDPSETRTQDFDELIMAVGQIPEPAMRRVLKEAFGGGPRIEVEPETLQVRDRPGLFAGGDIVRGAATVVEAVADGRRAAESIHAYLQ